jgi:hypothetical protein
MRQAAWSIAAAFLFYRAFAAMRQAKADKQDLATKEAILAFILAGFATLAAIRSPALSALDETWDDQQRRCAAHPRDCESAP